ncbi:MAG: hypothetical protein VB118_07130 [Oscillospiraceae bacterium]|nr:hypothetical protein [Oscillospiraceae bacterium]
MKKSFVFLFMIIIMLSACSSNEKKIAEEYESNMKNNELFIFPGGGYATYKYIDRNLYLNDFTKIKVGMTYKEIINIIGEPNGVFGSGVQWPFYETFDKSYIILYIGLESYSKLISIRIVDASGRIFDLQQEAE